MLLGLKAFPLCKASAVLVLYQCRVIAQNISASVTYITVLVCAIGNIWTLEYWLNMDQH